MTPQTYRLVMQTGPNPGKTYDLSKSEITLGRDTTNDVAINDAEVSRKHARITLQGGSFILEDLGSTNGTFVDGRRLMGPHSLSSGDLVLLGENVSLRFEAAAFDPNATVVSAPPFTTTEGAPGAATFEEPLPPFDPIYQAQELPDFPGDIPGGAVVVETPPAQKRSRTPLIVGAGCLVLLCCGCIALAVAIDQFVLYCTPPFDLIFGTLGFCP